MIRIGAAQSPVSPDPRANGASIRELVRAARDGGARLVHFPEGALGGYPHGAAEKRRLAGWDIDWTVVDEELERIAELAAALRIWVVLGCNHRNPHPLLPHNSLYAISDEGALVGRYDKRIVSHTEYTSFYTPGAEPLVIEIDGFRFGCVLCIEINFPELFLDYRARNVDCVLFSTFSDDPIFEVLARGHAAAHNSWMSVSVASQSSASVPAGVIGPHGYRLASCAAGGEPGVVCVDLNRDDPALAVALTKARPWRAEARLRYHCP